MSSPKTWTVVVFEEEKTVQAVPTRWIMGDQCLWPAVPKHQIPGIIVRCDYNSCWPSHKVRILRNSTFDQYSIARNKAKKAEVTSDINTSEDEGTQKKRLRKRRRISSSEDSISEVENNHPHTRKLLSPPTWASENIENKSDNGSQAYHSTLQEIEENVGSQAYHSTLQEIEENVGSQAYHSTRITSTPHHSTLLENEENVDMPVSSNTLNRCQCNSKVLYNIQSLLVEVNEKVTKLAYDIRKNKNHDSQTNKSNILQRSKVAFPIISEDDFNKFDEFLHMNNQNYEDLVSFFVAMGGNNLYDFVKRCISPIISDHIAQQFSFIGKKGKRDFSKYLISKAVLDSAQKSGVSQTKRETELKIGDWLRRAPERTKRTNNG